MIDRIGIGYDIHPFAPNRPLVLGGVTIPYEQGLAGHSDADVLLHAIADAILGAAALGDIGQHFPPDDERWRDADSIELLMRAALITGDAGYRLVNVDATVIAEAPKIMPHAQEIRDNLAHALDLPLDAVSVKATTNERLGAIGRGEGIAAIAIAGLSRTGSD